MCLILAVGLALAGCDAPGVTECEQHIKEELKAPASYRRIDAVSFSLDTSVVVDIEYDAANSFNAPIRATRHCSFKYADGKLGDLTSSYEMLR